ncbi:MAG: NAD(P)/FAD-dependent oxidoreductase [Candidatus Thorarchaeota archaeon]|nr:NAD(P)/FAD-dependent oxidoreductase [Candidatus Thorarchaeota archaeon]
MTRVAIIGNGVAATTAVREIRSKDQTLEIDVFSDERHPYYPRPNLIDLVANRRTVKETIQHDLDWYEKNDVDLFLSTPVFQIDTEEMAVMSTSEDYKQYDSILIAVGCRPFIPPFEGLDKNNIHVIRTLDDALDIRDAVKGAGQEIIIGGGILGIELAAAMKEVGGDPIVVDYDNHLLPLQLDTLGSSVLAKLLGKKGIQVRFGYDCRGILGDRDAEGIVSKQGEEIAGDLVVIATGVRSNTIIAKNSGIEIHHGILADEHMQTSAKGVFAAGDCMEWKNNEWYGIIPWATATGRIAAQNMMEFGSAKFEGITPSNQLQVAGIDLTSIGIALPESPEYETIVSVDHDEGKYYKAVLKDDVLVGGIALGSRKVALKLRSLIMKGENIADIKQSLFEDV